MSIYLSRTSRRLFRLGVMKKPRAKKFYSLEAKYSVSGKYIRMIVSLVGGSWNQIVSGLKEVRRIGLVVD